MDVMMMNVCRDDSRMIVISVGWFQGRFTIDNNAFGVDRDASNCDAYWVRTG